jgi:hypothetical protein
VVPCCVESFSLDSSVGGLVVLEDVEGDAIEEGEVLRGVSCSFSAEVFAEADIEHPMQLVFNAPVLSDGPVEPCIALWLALSAST